MNILNKIKSKKTKGLPSQIQQSQEINTQPISTV